MTLPFEIAPKQYETALMWIDAMFYCRLLNIDGKEDWRLPTKEELDQIYRMENDFVCSAYWTSTKNYGWFVNIQNLSTGKQCGVNRNNTYFVRPVRSK